MIKRFKVLSERFRFVTICLALMVTFMTPAMVMADTVSGRVFDENSEPLAGATVRVLKSKKATMTDMDGNYSLKDVPAGATVEVSYVGYATQNKVWKGGKLDFQLQSSTTAMDEVVVIGYATVKKKDLTGAVSAVGTDRLETQRSPSLASALQGQLPGLKVSRSGSMPGTGASVQIRGVTTLSDNSPLILVDGSPVSSLDVVNPEDVQQVSVLKDAAAASIYGARAAAGVILITTKSAKEGDLHLSYAGEYSIQEAASLPQFMTHPLEWMPMMNELKWNDSGNPEGQDYPVFSKDDIANYMQLHEADPVTYPVYNWQGALMRKTAPRQKHTLSMVYGNKQVKTRISTSYEESEALYPGSKFQRVYLRANNEIKFNSHWTANVDLAMRHNKKDDPNSGSPIAVALVYPQYYMGTYPDGRWAPGQSGSNEEARLKAGGQSHTYGDNLTGKISLTYKPIDALSIQANISPNMTFTKIKNMANAIPYYDYEDPGVKLGYISDYASNNMVENRNEATSIEKSLIATYMQEFGAHSLNAMAGYEDYSYNHESLAAASNQMSLSGYPYLDLANKNILVVGGSAYENAYRSFFGRVMYNYGSRYFLQTNIRGDASSRFHKNYRWGWFPSASLGWRVSNEKFMEPLQQWISNLMVRGSYGSLGNERIGNYPYQATINFTNAIMFGKTGATSQSTAAQVSYAVEDITWESTHTWNVGFDLSMLDSRLDLTADVYYKKTKDMLLSMAIPKFTGYGAPDINAGDMNTKGWELKLSWRDNIGKDWNYGAGFNISNSKSVMGNLGGKIMYSGDCIITEGQEYMAYYGYRALGLFQSVDEANESPKLLSNATAGDLKYKDLGGADGTPDGKIDATYDREILGSSLPHFLYGGYLQVGWKGLQLSASFNGVGKQTAYRSQRMAKALINGFHGAPVDVKDNYWSYYNTPEKNATVFYPRLTRETKNNYDPTSDYWLFDGSFFRMKSINLSYELPKQLIKKISFNRVRVFFNVDDPFVISHYPTGWDPEANSSASNYIARAYTFGLDFSF